VHHTRYVDSSLPSSDSTDVATLAAAAERFLTEQRWCASVLRVTPVFALSGVLGVFRCSLIPSDPAADAMVWVVVGDLPPAYLVHEPGDSWQDALRGYVEEMGQWVAAARTGSPIEDVIPVNVPATPEYADLLASRLTFIRTRLVEVDPDSVESDV
jgi:hypothetical protein